MSNNEQQSGKAIHLSPYNDDIGQKEVGQERMTRWNMYNSWREKKKNIYTNETEERKEMMSIQTNVWSKTICNRNKINVTGNHC